MEVVTCKVAACRSNIEMLEEQKEDYQEGRMWQHMSEARKPDKGQMSFKK
jgi:hypothetical protein